VLNALANSGLALQALGELEDAQPFFERSLAVRIQVQGGGIRRLPTAC